MIRAAVVMVLLLAVLAPTASAKTLAVDGQLAQRVLTQDGGTTYVVAKLGDTATVHAPAGQGGNHRQLFWQPRVRPRLGGTVCATWSAEAGPGTQQGLALAIVAGRTTRAVTVTKNVVFGITWVLNVHVWDTSLAVPFAQVGQHDMWHVVGGPDGLKSLPWRMCARLAGDVLTLKLWLPSQPEPSWVDPQHTRSTVIPAAWAAPGQVGWYAGHIPAHGALVYTQMQTR